MIWVTTISIPGPEFWICVAFGIAVLSVLSFLWRLTSADINEAKKMLRRLFLSTRRLFRLDIKIVFTALAVAVLLVPIELYLYSGSWLRSSYELSWPWIGLSLADMLVFWVLSPVIEEIFYRGLILRYLRGKLGLAITLLVTSLLFALSHKLTIDADPIGGFLTILIAGFEFGLLAAGTGTLTCPILAHAAYNILIFVIRA